MISFLAIAFLLACISAFLILVGEKTGVLDKIAQWVGPGSLQGLFDCVFCMSFWLSVIMVLFIVLFTGNLILFFVPIVSSVIARRLV